MKHKFETSVQVLTLITAASATFVITFWIQHKDSSGYLAKLAALVAFACFVLSGCTLQTHMVRTENKRPCDERA